MEGEPVADGPVSETQPRGPFSLRSMRAGEIGMVSGVCDKGPSARRLAEFGLVRGATVQMIRSGAPCILRIEHTRLSVGASLQDGVLLAPVSLDTRGQSGPKTRTGPSVSRVPVK